MHVSELATPALLVDLNALEHNLYTMAGFFENSPVGLRPHFKNHKCLRLAEIQMQAGAIGLTCATIREAECLVNDGFTGVLIANEFTSANKLARFLNLAEKADVILAIDNATVAERLGKLARERGLTPGVLVDVDVGLQRCGVRTGATAIDLARVIVSCGLRMRGIMGYEGQLLRQPRSAEKTEAIHSEMHKLLETKQSLLEAGFPVEIVSVGGTGSYEVSGSLPGITELQAGSYLLMETDYAEVCPEFEVALTVLTTVVSKAHGERVVLDAGIKAISCERGFPKAKAWPGLTTDRVNAEHTILSIASEHEPPEIGAQVELWVRYGDGTVNLHDRMFGMRAGVVEEIFTLCK